MIRLLRYLVLCLIIETFYTGCGGEPEKRYDGFTLREWVRSLDSPEPGIRQDALEIICSIGLSAREWERSVRAVALHDEDNIVKMKAIEALEAMGAPIVEFQEFIDLYNAPLIPDGNEYFESSEEDVDKDILENISGEDDLEFLEKLESGELDESTTDTGLVPSDSTKLAEWVNERQADTVRDLLLSLENPDILSKILIYGNQLQREYAARALAGMSGDNPAVVSVLESASNNDPVADIRKFASEALKKWKKP